MYLNGFNDNYDDATDANVQITQHPSRPAFFRLEEFGFGWFDKSSEQAAYKSILNSDSGYGLNANSATFTMNFQGIGLPVNQHRIFADALDTITEGRGKCDDYTGAYCTLNSRCSDHRDVLTDYSFKIVFTDNTPNDYYLRVPLGAFANDNYEHDTCNIFVQQLVNDNRGYDIQFGAMFFQAFYTRMNYSSSSITWLKFFVNNLAAGATMIDIGNQAETPVVFSKKPEASSGPVFVPPAPEEDDEDSTNYLLAVGIVLACLCVIAVVWAACVQQNCGADKKDFFSGANNSAKTGGEIESKQIEGETPDTDRKLKNEEAQV